ncbi:glycoside hydrolase family 81 protein [Stemphylium lycopersici]|nr:glycoside hydrolase family 81 protein [Stemphylium lycopersici]
MPPRVARSSLQSGGSSAKGRSNARNPKKAQRRALDAFSIAQHDNLDDTKIRKNRLGEFDPAFNRKRARDDGDDDEEEDEDDDDGAGPKRRKRRSGDESYDEGSDSDGNTWQMGHVDNDDDDESIDSDEAFGDSDEERFEGYTFRGSSKSQKSKPKKSKRQQDLEDEDGDIDLDEGDSANGEEEDEDDLGEDAIDLATALDQYEEDEEEERREAKKQKKKQASTFDDSDEEPSEGEDVGADGASDLSSDDESDDDRQAQLQDLISSLASKESEKAKGKRVEVHESAAPDEFGVARKVDLMSLKPKAADAEKKKALKLLQDDKSSNRKDIARKLDAPLPKRQQDKLDRAAANAKANETLERWTDTIKRNRRAEHLMFPLQNASGGEPTGEKTLQPTTTSAPTNDLESTIQSILQQSGLSNGKEDEDKIQKWEELQTNKLPVEEVARRRAELRMQRELLFREEVRAKRIKKIKSKAYRRVHRKEREKMLEKEREQLKADGVDLSEEEREYNDRRRAEERMGAKHRDSKWAKGIKATGRANWDQDALDGVTEMARRNEELRRRVEGKTVRDDDEEGSDVPSDEESDDDDQSDNDALQKSLGKLKENPFSTGKSKIGEMAFMQRSEAARRAQNDEAVEAMRRELAGEDSENEELDENATKAGRRKYGPNANVAAPAIQINRSEFEEHPASDEEGVQAAADSEEASTEQSSNKATVSKKTDLSGLSNGARKERKSVAPPPVENGSGSSNPFLVKAKKEKKASKEPELYPAPEIKKPSGQEKAVVQSKPASKAKPQKKSKQAEKPQETKVDDFLKQRVTTADDDGWATVLGGQDDDEDQDEQALEDEGIDLDVVMRNHALTAKGFAGDDVEADFDAEKNATIAEEEATETTTFLPGWGSWTGDGMSKAEKKRNLGAKTVTQKPGIDANKRKDKKLDKVIINEKRAKPTTKYMASQLPFPFESREQYERSLRVPKGPEWVTKKTHQDVTRPRVIVKQGIIKPLRKPLMRKPLTFPNKPVLRRFPILDLVITMATADEISPDDIFTPIQADSILPQIPISRHHPVPGKGIEDDDLRTLHTNAFYANAFLGKQNQPIWTHPYSLWWGKGFVEAGMVQTWGMCVSHVEETDLVFEPGEPTNGYTNPLRKQNIILTAVELDSQTTLTTDTHLPFSVNVNLVAHTISSEPKITFPVVQGMSFITAGYRDAKPIIQTGGRGFVEMIGPTMLGRAVKYRLHDKTGQCWIMYVNPVSNIDYDAVGFRCIDQNTILGPPGFKGTIQVAKNPLGSEGEAMYDRASGSFVCEARIGAVIPDGRGTYTFRYTKIGRSPLLMFVLPHHIQSLDPDMRNQITKLQLRTPTKGMATAVWAEHLTFIEPNVPVTMHFGPWNPVMGSNTKVRYSPEVLAFIAAVAERDLRRAMTERIPHETIYYAGKAFARFATIVWVIKDILNHEAIANAGLDKLKGEFAKYVENQQRNPLYYDDNWKGVVSASGFTDPTADFGNIYFNDHHFHYAYFIYTAAIIGYLSPEWLNQWDNKAWTNMLVKDFAESDYNSRDYPFFRSFDWWHGHSWAKGLFESPDGKHMESTGEDAFSSYAVKMWGKVIGDANMEKRGKSTYFGLPPQLIHGIHMLPIAPCTSLIRPRAFVREEWDKFFSDGRANAVEGGWRGVLYANLALVDAKSSYTFFRDGIDGFWDERWIDSGASRTWYLVWAAAMSEFAKAGK